MYLVPWNKNDFFLNIDAISSPGLNIIQQIQ